MTQSTKLTLAEQQKTIETLLKTTYDLVLIASELDKRLKLLEGTHGKTNGK